eukprot:7113706-Heterocapsa_arctica.AAC.1
MARPRGAPSSFLAAVTVDMSSSGSISRTTSWLCARNQAARRLSGEQQYSKSLTSLQSTMSIRHSTMLMSSCCRPTLVARETCTGR